jgi:hypothetical protein
MKTKLPLLPVHGVVEHKLFQRLILTMLTPIDYDGMAIQWCHHVDGIYICIQRVLRLF